MPTVAAIPANAVPAKKKKSRTFTVGLMPGSRFPTAWNANGEAIRHMETLSQYRKPPTLKALRNAQHMPPALIRSF
ncbi:hypothetical protein V5E97_06665 [Singulisphaera sp. Ch08]|uniref:Uncharacterized protein n=1 Tax=Singulisphaera sp. Ch08 TaxID=3120278 RepID=A0AAU7CKM2_9BACT